MEKSSGMAPLNGVQARTTRCSKALIRSLMLIFWGQAFVVHSFLFEFSTLIEVQVLPSCLKIGLVLKIDIDTTCEMKSVSACLLFR